MAEAVPAFGSRLDVKIVIDTTNNVGAPSLNSLAVLAEHAHAPLVPLIRWAPRPGHSGEQ
jgi:8-hydroxy-5-deazaflavin:NADPH oxidoreductase